jgi:MauM/NapG family ferredoxin protein
LAAESKRARRGKVRPWRTARRLVQYVALLAFLALFVGARSSGWPTSLANLPIRLDPLAMLAYGIASRTVIAGSAVALVTVALTLVFGRAWCGWLCPLGTVLDLLSLRRWRGRRQPPSEGWRSAKYGMMIAILGAATLANLSLLIFDPLTLLLRTLSTSVWPGAERLLSMAEVTLYRLRPVRPAIEVLDEALRPALFPAEPLFYRWALPLAGVLVGIVLLDLLAERFWCRYLCPLGGLLGVLSKAALVQREVGSECKQCDLCARVCPTGTIQPSKGYASDPGECTMCVECLESCPGADVQFSLRLRTPRWQGYDPSRRQVLAVLGATVAGVALLRADQAAKRESPYLIRPPGAGENDLLAKCVRCGECIRACPTAAIQPSLAEAGLEGLWTPVLVPRLGYCDYACNACGWACPVQAIPPLTLEEKRQRVIGKAFVDQNRCIPWADFRDCIVCEEMCPIPDKAIVLEQYEGPNALGETVLVKRPRVLRDRCIGCGICEYKCPAVGEAAIRVYAPSSGGLA